MKNYTPKKKVTICLDEIQHEIEIPPIVEQSTEDTPWWSDESLDESH